MQSLEMLLLFLEFPDSHEIPQQILFAKILSQCFSPVLPAGIQTKALEVYRCVFKKAGSNFIINNFNVFPFH